MATSIVLAAGSRVGPGLDLQIGLGGTSAAGDWWQAVAKVGAAVKVAVYLTAQTMAAGLHTPDAVLGYDYILNRYILCQLEGMPDGQVFDLVVDWYSVANVLKGTSTTSLVWDPNSFTAGLLDIGFNANGPILQQILAAVRKTFQNTP